MVRTGLDNYEKELRPLLSNKKAGILCHSSGINADYEHITDIIHNSLPNQLSAIFGPQHGLFGQTQDNMIEWEGYTHPVFKVPVYSLYGKTRKPSGAMLAGTDIFIIDLQDVGTRPYTYAWTLKHCLEACKDNNIPVIVIDRPNPLGGIKRDGPVLKREFFTFVGGAEIPLCHGMTMGEIALWINERENINCRLEIIKMQGWQREMVWTDTGLPWVLPSPNMPTLNTAKVYPGMVLIEALNISEGRGTTLPFELCGAPFPEMGNAVAELNRMNLPGAVFRKHNFIPVFHKYAGEYCQGMQLHVTDFNLFEPVYTAACIFKVIADITGKLSFKAPPYEYEDKLMPFDILSGDTGLRNCLENEGSPEDEKERWKHEINEFNNNFNDYSLY